MFHAIAAISLIVLRPLLRCRCPQTPPRLFFFLRRYAADIEIFCAVITLSFFLSQDDIILLLPLRFLHAFSSLRYYAVRLRFCALLRAEPFADKVLLLHD